MRKDAGGLICVPMAGARLDELQIPQMVRDNTAAGTAFSVSVEARGLMTTGISAQDRAATIPRCSIPMRRRPTSCVRATRFRCARATAACSCARGKPRRRSISRGSRACSRPA